MDEPDLLLMHRAPQVCQRQPFVQAAEHLEQSMRAWEIGLDRPNPLERLGMQFLALVDAHPPKPGTRTRDLPEQLVRVVTNLQAAERAGQ